MADFMTRQIKAMERTIDGIEYDSACLCARQSRVNQTTQKVNSVFVRFLFSCLAFVTLTILGSLIGYAPAIVAGFVAIVVGIVSCHASNNGCKVIKRIYNW